MSAGNFRWPGVAIALITIASMVSGLDHGRRPLTGANLNPLQLLGIRSAQIITGQPVGSGVCLYQSTPSESALVVLITNNSEINGVVALNRHTVFNISKQPISSSENFTVHLQPLYGSMPNQHANIMPYTKEINVPTRSADLYLVVDNAMLLRPLNLHIRLVGLDLWSSEQQEMFDKKISETGNITYTLEHAISLRQHNVSAHNSLNSPDHSSLDAASIFTHELGHLLGLDHSDDCGCESEETCMMASASARPHSLRWSKCSLDKLEALLNGPSSPDCMKTFTSPPAKTRSICGNLVLEPGEEFDNKQLNSAGKACCTSLECGSNQLRVGYREEQKPAYPRELLVNYTDILERAAIHDRECLQAGGDNVSCTDNGGRCSRLVPKPDGASCNDMSGICIDGQCRCRDCQCRRLFGEQWIAGSNLCFKQNTIGTAASGYCNYRLENKSASLTSTYKFEACAPEDQLCGVLHCMPRDKNITTMQESRLRVEKTPFSPIYSTVLRKRDRFQKPGDKSGKLCIHGRAERWLTGKPDPGLVENGTPCGANQVGHKKQLILTLCNNTNAHFPDAYGGNGFLQPLKPCSCYSSGPTF
ncbi:unnamed protein product [Calicophoron daubneyi]|uniref:Peptidase M12B domain-containing protein n=1 Tax=Calicophoron daubneyi TaxID=300641 RepID=A0AAV2T6E3_CALDB